MTNEPIQHIAMEESTSMQWVKGLLSVFIQLMYNFQASFLMKCQTTPLPWIANLLKKVFRLQF